MTAAGSVDLPGEDEVGDATDDEEPSEEEGDAEAGDDGGRTMADEGRR